MKKIFAVMFLFLMAVPAFAGTIVQGNNNFTYSPEMDEIINSAMEDVFTSVNGSSFVLKDLNTLFPERLAAVAFSVSYTPAGKPAIMPGYLNLTFSESDIASFPNGALILQEIRNSSDPVSALFKYFDPTVLVYGPDGNLTAVNLKSMSSNFTLSSVDAGTMLLAAPIVPADGYPVTGFFVETAANYLLVYDAMVSQGSASKTGDGQIEFAFGLVPNGNVQASTFYPVIETNTGKGYVVFDDPSSLLDVPELHGFVPAEISSGSTVFSDVEGGFSFETACTPHGVSSVVVSLYVDAQTAQSLPDDFKVEVNGYPVTPSVTGLPGGALYANVKFLLADGTFASDVFVSNGMIVLFDGEEDGRLVASLVLKDEVSTDTGSVIETTDNGYVMIDDPASFFSIPEVAAKNPVRAQVSTVNFGAVPDGYSFEIPYSDSGTGAILVSAFVKIPKSRLEEMGYPNSEIAVKVGDAVLTFSQFIDVEDLYSLPKVSLLPDGSALVSIEYLLVDDSFVVSSFLSDSDGLLVVFDGQKDGILKSSVQVVEYKYSAFDTIVRSTAGGYFKLEDPSGFFYLPELSFLNPVVPSISSVTTEDVENGFRLSAEYNNAGTGAVFTTVFLNLSPDKIREFGISSVDQVLLKVNGKNLVPDLVQEQPDGSYSLSLSFLAVDENFTPKILNSGGTLIVFDGEKDGKIEVEVFAVPREIEKPVSDNFPVEKSTGNGHIIFEYPEVYLDIPQLKALGVSPAIFSPDDVSLTQNDGGYTVEIPCSGEYQAVLMTPSVVIPKDQMKDAEDVFITANGHKIATTLIETPNGDTVASAVFLLVDGSFSPEAFISDEKYVVFDGTKDGRLTAEIKVVIKNKSVYPVAVSFDGGYAVLYDPSEYMNVDQFSGIKWETAPYVEPTFERTENGVKFEMPYTGSLLGVLGVRLSLTFSSEELTAMGMKEGDSLSVKINGYPVASQGQSDSSVVVDIIAADRKFSPAFISSEGRIYLSDGAKDGKLSFTVTVEITKTSPEESPYPFTIQTPNGNIVFKDPTEYLNIPELSGIAAAQFLPEDVAVDGGSFDISCSESSAALARVSIFVTDEELEEMDYSNDSVLYLTLNGYRVSCDVTVVPGGVVLSRDVLMVDGSFSPSVFESDGVLVLFDGAKDGRLKISAGWEMEKGQEEAGSRFPTGKSCDNGYVLFKSPDDYLDIPELAAKRAKVALVNDIDIETLQDGFKVDAAYENSSDVGVVFVTASVYLKDAGEGSTLTVNGKKIDATAVALPDGIVLTVQFVLVDDVFMPDVINLQDAVIVFDGVRDGHLTFEAKAVKKTETSRYITYRHDRGALKIDTQGALPDEFRQVLPSGGSFSPAVISLLEGFTGQVAPVSLNVSYDNAKENSAVTGVFEFTVFRSDVPSLQISSNAEALDYLRPVVGVKGVFFDVYDFLRKNGAESLMGVSGTLDTGLTFSVPVIMADSSAFGISLGDSAIVIKDGSLDGKFLIETYVGILKKQQESKVVFNSEKIQLKTRNIILPDSYDIDMESDVDFEALDAEDWPGMDGVAGAVFAGGFTGSVSSGRGVSLTVSSSVTAAELKKMDKSRYDKMLTAWTAGEKSKFLSYYHLYKKINNDIYDLVLAGDKNIFTISGDPNSKIVISFPAVIVDGENMVPVVYDESAECFIIYDGNKDGKVRDPLFVGLPEITEEPEEEPEEEPKHILPDNPTGSSMGNDDLKDWIKVFSLF